MAKKTRGPYEDHPGPGQPRKLYLKEAIANQIRKNTGREGDNNLHSDAQALAPLQDDLEKLFFLNDKGVSVPRAFLI